MSCAPRSTLSSGSPKCWSATWHGSAPRGAGAASARAPRRSHLLALINQVLDLSKIEAGNPELTPQSVQLTPLIDDVAGTAPPARRQNKNRLVVEAPENLGTLTVDPMRLRQILLNL